MQGIIEACMLLILLGFGYYGILNVENQILYGIYFSFEALYFYTGYLAFALLFVGLWLPKPYGRIIGILALGATCLHFLIFMHLDFGLDLKLMTQKILSEKPLVAGSLSFLVMVLVFFVSLLQAFRRFKMFLLVYLSLFLALLHILMLQKILDAFYYLLLGITLCALAFKVWRIVK
ncbi:hypothetical protein [Helicobacter turcicus]|uniref:Ferric reductase n=1 Tax=Helicobacter turcicus TaxID=2867412 RepID=A0ABS7JME1_9HELI|nr:hypothetical protein [Helicobacter turcicus]MBX7490552.1 hypothetical protein [Helicobacter turcicus]MBX7545538.1 hypothetical protein [Helicobacter turcicus]